MTGIALDLDLEGEDFFNFSEVVQRSSEDLLNQIGDILIDNLKVRFSNEEAPDGSSWEPSARAKGGGKTLHDRGNLLDSFTYVATEDSLTLGSNLIYAAIHHFGGVIEPKEPGGKLKFKIGDRWVQTDSVTIPERKILGISDFDREDMGEIWHQSITGAL